MTTRRQIISRLGVLATASMWPRVLRAAPAEVLSRFDNMNLQATFDGHFHGQTERTYGKAKLITGACCGRVVPNHDGKTQKGWWLCQAGADGVLTRDFVQFDGTI